MQNWLTDFINSYGYIAVAFLVALENIFPPIPSEIILTFGGFLTAQGSLNIFGVIIAATIGSVVGAVALYYAGAVLGLGRLERFVGKWGHFLRVTSNDIRKADAWFRNYGAWAVFICRFIPLVRSLISIPAGLSRMRFTLFLTLTAAGTLIWNTVLVYLGASVGSSWKQVVSYMDMYSRIMYGILALLLIVGGIYFIKTRKRRK